MGRPPANPNLELIRQRRENEKFRNAIEGKFGQAKRRFSLNRVMAKLSALIWLIHDKMKLEIAIIKMPIDTSLYPDNWSSLALSVKEAANWCCECCGKKCYEPGERPESLIRAEWTADILQVHHRNHNTSDNRLSNLMSVCASCHLGLHRGGQYSSVSEGQLSLW